jgi:predicted transcriptional regulator
MDWTLQSLKVLGLNVTEVTILSAISVAKTVQDIAKDTDISRTGINYSLSQLEKKGLVRSVKYGKRFRYIALSPQEVALSLQSVIDAVQIDTSIKKGARVKASKESEIVIYHGIKEILPAHDRIATHNKNTRIKAIQPNKSWMNLHKKLTPEQLIHFNDTIRKNELVLDAVLQSDAYVKYGEFFKHDPQTIKAIAESFADRMADYTAVEKTLFDFHTEIWLFEQTVFIINWQEEIAIEITNKDIMGFIKDMYDVVKATGKKIDHNQAMRDLLETVK